MSNVKLVQTGKYEFMDGFQFKKKKAPNESFYKLLFTCNSAPAYAATEGLHLKGV